LPSPVRTKIFELAKCFDYLKQTQHEFSFSFRTEGSAS
jgi:hypothetical protein